eukprot:1157839-Pelagomonas_calceolata.AAC.6
MVFAQAFHDRAILTPHHPPTDTSSFTWGSILVGWLAILLQAWLAAVQRLLQGWRVLAKPARRRRS